jgi:FkbM family methyltransferase
MKKVLTKLRDPKYALYRFARSYVKKYEGFSYDFDRNGERLLVERLKAFDMRVIFDVGANIGDWTLMAKSNFPAAEIHSFELSEATFSTLKNRVKGEGITLNNFGLSQNEGEIVYKDYGADSGVNTILESADFHDHRIEFSKKKGIISTGDRYCSERNIEQIDFLKIDVEGAEHLVLEGFKQLLSKKKVKVIQFEYGYTNADAHFLMKDFYELFSNFGYSLGPLKPSGVLFGDFKYPLNDFNSGPNFVAVSKECTKITESIKGTPIRGYA